MIQKHFFTSLAINTSPNSVWPRSSSPMTTRPSGYAVLSFAVTSCSACLTSALARLLSTHTYGSGAAPGALSGVRRSLSWLMMRRVAEAEAVSWPILGLMDRLAAKQAER